MKDNFDTALKKHVCLRSIREIAACHATAEHALNVLQDLRQEVCRRQPNRYDLEDAFDELADLVFNKLHDLSWQVAARPAEDLDDLRMKSEVWLARSLPEHTDDISTLAFSICHDIVTLTTLHGEAVASGGPGVTSSCYDAPDSEPGGGIAAVPEGDTDPEADVRRCLEALRHAIGRLKP